MNTKKFYIKHILKITLICSLVLAFGTAYSQDYDAKDKAKVWKIDSESLKWGPCPGFMPDDCRITVLHGNPKKPNTDIFFKMQGNTTIPRHWHTSPERMVLVSGKMRVKYDGQPWETVKEGNYAYGPSQRPHIAKCTSVEPCVLFIGFEDPIDAFPMTEEVRRN